MTGRFLVLDGLDGCGKSTQARRLVTRLEDLGRQVLHTREPGGTAVGERVRALLLDPALGDLVPMSEVFLYQAARAQLAQAVIAPALAAGTDVVCERWHFATSAYQAAGGGADERAVRVTSALATDGLEPDRAVLLDLAVEEALARMDGPPDRIEARDVAYKERVAAGFRRLFRRDPARRRIVSASGEPGQVAADVWEAVADLFVARTRESDA